MKAKYIRVSSEGQNVDRQLSNGCKDYIDTCSGSTAFSEREKASKLLKDIDNGLITEVHVHSIDRLGRNTLDIMQTIQNLTNKGINVVSEKEGLRTLINGKENPIAKLLIGILGTLAEFELTRIKERQKEGIAKAKERGSYKNNGGRIVESIEVFISKSKNKNCAKHLKAGQSLRNAAKLSSVSLGTAQKINKMINEGII